MSDEVTFISDVRGALSCLTPGHHHEPEAIRFLYKWGSQRMKRLSVSRSLDDSERHDVVVDSIYKLRRTNIPPGAGQGYLLKTLYSVSVDLLKKKGRLIPVDDMGFFTWDLVHGAEVSLEESELVREFFWGTLCPLVASQCRAEAEMNVLKGSDEMRRLAEGLTDMATLAQLERRPDDTSRKLARNRVHQRHRRTRQRVKSNLDTLSALLLDEPVHLGEVQPIVLQDMQVLVVEHRIDILVAAMLLDVYHQEMRQRRRAQTGPACRCTSETRR